MFIIILKENYPSVWSRGETKQPCQNTEISTTVRIDQTSGTNCVVWLPLAVVCSYDSVLFFLLDILLNFILIEEDECNVL